MPWRRLGFALACLTLTAPLVSLSGCTGSRTAPAGAERPGTIVSYEEIRSRYNQRTSRLHRIWSRAVVSMRWQDEEGRSRSEQGEGHLQLEQPTKLALSAGKLGEILIWFGSDAERYWLIDRTESKRAYFGRHDAISRRKLASLGLPAAPSELLTLLGIRNLPSERTLSEAGWTVNVAQAGRGEGSDGSLVVELRGRTTLWRYVLEPKELLPTRIELWFVSSDAPTESRAHEVHRRRLLSATLENYDDVELKGVGGFFPKLAGRVRITDESSGAVLGLSLAGMSDKASRAEAFDLDSLLERLGPMDEIVDLDERLRVRD